MGAFHQSSASDLILRYNGEIRHKRAHALSSCISAILTLEIGSEHGCSGTVAADTSLIAELCARGYSGHIGLALGHEDPLHTSADLGVSMIHGARTKAKARKMATMRPLHAVLKHPAHSRSSLVRQCNRSYHSYEHGFPPPFSPTEDAILSAALSHVPAHGFTSTALTQGARDAGYLDISTNLFSTGAFSIVNYHLVTQRLALAKHASSLPPQPDITSNIRSLALHRLRANKLIIHRWQEALALLSTARHLPTSLRELALLSDELLFLAGSTTVTSAWYTNRAALAAIYASAELFMTQDKSKGFEETEEFLTRRLEEGEKVRGGLDMLGKWVGMQAGGLVDGLRSKGVWI